MDASQRIWLISVNMGYGHQRTAYPLKFLASSKGFLNANDYQGIPPSDRRVWEESRRIYELVTNFKRFPVLGELVFSVLDRLQKIFSFYPKRDLSGSNFQLKQIYGIIKKGWGKHIVLRLRGLKQGERALPMVSTFFTPAFMAEVFNYPGEIFCVVCDADISRTWAPLDPKSSRIKYLTPNERTTERLKMYGVKPENIFLTGFPLPVENIGGESMEILKHDLKNRLLNLDPRKKYFSKYKTLIEESLGVLPESASRPLTILFSVGGAGAQKEIGAQLVKGLAREIESGQVKIILSAGIRPGVKNYFEDFLKNKVRANLGEKVEILFGQDMDNYFRKFNQALRETDILWTKPSELSFYSALGMPIIIAPPIGSQEEFNKRWLLKSGFGLAQEDLGYVRQWLFDWLDQGYLAEAAMQGFIEGEKMGTFNIKKMIWR